MSMGNDSERMPASSIRRAIQSGVSNALFPRYWRDLQNGQKLTFGPIALDNDRLYAGRKELTWQEIPTVTPTTAIEQCIAYGTPTYLLRQAIERGHAQGFLKTAERNALADQLADEFLTFAGTPAPALSEYAVSRAGIYEEHP